MTFADVQLIDRIRFQEHVPPAGSFEVYSSPRGGLSIFTNRDQRSALLGFESRMSVFFGVLATVLYFFGLLKNCFTADVCQPWTNYVNNGNKYLIIGAVVSSEYSNI